MEAVHFKIQSQSQSQVLNSASTQQERGSKVGVRLYPSKIVREMDESENSSLPMRYEKRVGVGGEYSISN